LDKIWIYVWKQRKLGEVFEQTTNFVNPDKGEIELWSLTVEDGLTPKSERYNREFLVKKNANFKKVRPGDIVYNPMNMTLGAVGYNGMLKNVAVSGYYITMFVKTGYDSYYINTWLKSPQALSLYKTFATGSLIEKQRVQFSTLSIIPTVFPEYEEQKRIGCYFNNLDSLITFHHRKLNILNKICRYAWEQRKFDDLADYKKGPFGSALKKDMFVPKSDMTVKVYEQQNAINKDWHLERYFITEEYANKLSGFRVEGGDIIVSCAGTIGETYEIPLDAEPGIINQALMRIKVKESIVNKKMFNILFTNMINDFTRVHSNGSAIKNIPPFSDLKPMVVFVPKMDEQNKISSYFSNLDHLITLHQQKCKQLQIIRKFMLKNMFL
jgi:type I restriction enzyme S subunit